MRLRISVTVGEKTHSLDIQSPDSIESIKTQIYGQLETQRFVKIPYTNAIYRCEIVDRVTVQEW